MSQNPNLEAPHAITRDTAKLSSQDVPDDIPAAVSLTLYLRDKSTNAQLAEVRVNRNATLGALRSHIRDCPAMAALPQRMFSHWWVKTRASVFPTKIPTDTFSDEYLLSDAGIEDEGTLLLELRGATGAESHVLGGSDATGTDGYAAAVVAADRRSEQRMDLVLKALTELKTSHAQLQHAHAKLGADVTQLKKDNAAYANDFVALEIRIGHLKSDNLELKGRVKALQGHAAAKQLQEQMAARVDEVRAAVSVQPHPSYAPMTVATPCGPSTYTITYPQGGTKAVVICHEKYSNLPAGPKGRPRLIHFPKATLPAGARCLVEFTLNDAPNAKDTKGCGLRIGFVPASSTGLNELVYELGAISKSYTLNYFGTKLLNGASSLTELPKITKTSSVRRVAFLMDRTDAANSFLRVFVSEDGTDEGVKPHGEAKTVIKPPEVDYIPAANLVGQSELTIHNIYFGNDIPACYAV